MISFIHFILFPIIFKHSIRIKDKHPTINISKKPPPHLTNLPKFATQGAGMKRVGPRSKITMSPGTAVAINSCSFPTKLVFGKLCCLDADWRFS